MLSGSSRFSWFVLATMLSVGACSVSNSEDGSDGDDGGGGRAGGAGGAVTGQGAQGGEGAIAGVDASSGMGGSAGGGSVGGMVATGGMAGGNPISGDLVVMPLGDSITGEPRTYRQPLYPMLTAAGCKVQFVGGEIDMYTDIPQKRHQGHPGFSVGKIAADIDKWLAAQPPKIVLLMIGTNDIAWYYGGTAAAVADQQAQLVDRILAAVPDVWIVVASIPPESSKLVEPNNYDREVMTRQVNAELKKRVDVRIAAGKHIRWADVHAAMVVDDLRDGIHPTVPGYLKIAQTWFDALKPLAACIPD